MTPPRRIQQLSTALVNRIAAGEVIERPASVVKELVENALDACATRIIIEIEDGGRELIRVIDDGHGIPPSDLPLAFAEHATSKITSDDDLFRIATMGFRGEALASIGSVSHARILSRTPDSDAAYEILNRGGEVSTPQATAGNVGTVVEIRNLFYNTPARRKFLKGAPTEFGQISEAVLRLALPYPHVAFKLSHGPRKSLDLPAIPPNADPVARLLEAWPDDFAEMRLPLEARDAELRIVGLIGLPELARPTAKYQFLYLNGRHIRDKFIQHALREAFRGLTEPGRHPAAILMITIPPGDVDVNVHPTKVEVRFKDSGRIHGLVLSAIREKLLGSDLTPRAIPFIADNVEQTNRADLRSTLSQFFQTPPTASSPFELQSQPSPTPSLDFTPRAWPIANSGSPINSQNNTAEHSRIDVTTIGQSPSAQSPISNLESQISNSQSQISNPKSEISNSKSEIANPPLPFPSIQLHNSYLVTQTPEGMLIIDQHALHERIMYEELKSRIISGSLESQRMLIPPTLPATTRQIALLETIGPLLARLGIEISPFGPETLAVHAFPTFLSRVDPVDFVAGLLERGEQELLDLHDEELLHEVLDMMACKAAVKAGDPLTPGEIQALLARKDLVDRSSNCPHGRPTTLRLSLRDLEKQFKRTGF